MELEQGGQAGLHCGLRAWRRRGCRAFTMVEVAISLAIVGFALTAILGVLPAGMNVQKSNRDDTLINQEGLMMLEAIRNGTMNFYTLTNMVDDVAVYCTNSKGVPKAYTNIVLNSPAQIMGLLSIPSGALYQANKAGPSMYATQVVAKVRVKTGTVAQQGTNRDARDFAFSYLLQPEIRLFTNYGSYMATNPASLTNASLSLYELKLVLRWPVFGKQGAWRAGNRRQVFRTLVNASITNFLAAPTNNGIHWYFFDPYDSRSTNVAGI
jgi:prepilin-type N-terminal cleavage/methylation domain-containing protein